MHIMSRADEMDRCMRVLVKEDMGIADNPAGGVSANEKKLEGYPAPKTPEAQAAGTGRRGSIGAEKAQTAGGGRHRFRSASQTGQNWEPYMPTDDTWMDTSWARMEPGVIQSTSTWPPTITQPSANEPGSDTDRLYPEDSYPDNENWEGNRFGRSDFRRGNLLGRNGRPVRMAAVCILLGLLAAAAIFGHMRSGSESEAEVFIEEYMEDQDN